MQCGTRIEAASSVETETSAAVKWVRRNTVSGRIVDRFDDESLAAVVDGVVQKRLGAAWKPSQDSIRTSF